MNYFKKSFFSSLLALLVTLTATAQVGIGTTTPSANTKFEIIAAGSTSATTSLRVGTASGTTLLSVKDNGSIGIGTLTPASSAALEVSSTTGGFLPPRMTYSQRLSITSPSSGMIIFCTDCGPDGEMQFYLSNVNQWYAFSRTTATTGSAGGTTTPSVTTNTVTSYDQTTATLRGSVSGSASYGGFYYSTSESAITTLTVGSYSQTTRNFITPPTFTNYITGLTPSTTYYIRAFVAATSSGTETIATNTVSFTTSSSSGGTATLTVTTNPVGSSTSSTANLSGSITSGMAYSPAGFYYSTDQTAINNLAGSYSSTNGSLSASNISATLSGLTSSTTYYVRAFASTFSGTIVSASNTVSFTTGSAGGGGGPSGPSIGAPIATRTPSTGAATSYDLLATVNSFGGSASGISRAYFEYDQSGAFAAGVLTTTATFYPSGGGGSVGSLSGSIPASALSSGTTWYVRAVAINNLSMSGTSSHTSFSYTARTTFSSSNNANNGNSNRQQQLGDVQIVRNTEIADRKIEHFSSQSDMGNNSSQELGLKIIAQR